MTDTGLFAFQEENREISLENILSAAKSDCYDIESVGDKRRTVSLIQSMVEAMNGENSVSVQKICLFALTEADLKQRNGLMEFTLDLDQLAAACGVSKSQVCKELKVRSRESLQDKLQAVTVSFPDGTVDRNGIPNRIVTNWFYVSEYRDKKLHLMLHPEVYDRLRQMGDIKETFSFFKYEKIRKCQNSGSIRTFMLLSLLGLAACKGGQCVQPMSIRLNVYELMKYFHADEKYANRYTQFAEKFITYINNINLAADTHILISGIQKERRQNYLDLQYDYYELVGVSRAEVFHQERIVQELGETGYSEILRQIDYDSFTGLSEQEQVILDGLVRAMEVVYAAHKDTVLFTRSGSTAGPIKESIRAVNREIIETIIENVMHQVELNKVDLSRDLTNYYIRCMTVTKPRKKGKRKSAPKEEQLDPMIRKALEMRKQRRLDEAEEMLKRDGFVREEDLQQLLMHEFPDEYHGFDEMGFPY